MTKYSTIETRVKKQTIFKKFISADMNVKDAALSPNIYNNVVFIGHNKCYGDVFKVYDDGDENNYTLYFGEAGDEFNQ
jgi:hypothetical protein